LNDGAAALLIMSEEKANELDLEPWAHIIASASAGVVATSPPMVGIPAAASSARAWYS
jgi:acetyl-CoA C-acetyltransferase